MDCSGIRQSMILGCMEHASARVPFFFFQRSPVPPRPKVKDERGWAAAGWLLVEEIAMVFKVEPQELFGIRTSGTIFIYLEVS